MAKQINTLLRNPFFRMSIVRTTEIVVLLTLVGTGSVAGFASWRYGSIKNAVARANGQILLPDAAVKSREDVPANRETRIVYKVRNLTGNPVRLQGSQTSCSCTVLEGLPRTIPPWDDTVIEVQVMTGSPGQKMIGGMDLITDESNQPVLHLGYALQVAAGSSVDGR